MGNERNFLRMAIVWALDAGLLDGENLTFDGEPLREKGPMSATGYDPNTGWSVRSSHGCRRHVDLDQRIDELMKSPDPIEREVAKDFPQWFGWGEPIDGTFVAPWDLPDDQLLELNQARDRHLITVSWLSPTPRSIMAMDFYIRPDGQSTSTLVPGHMYLWTHEENNALLHDLAPGAILDLLDRHIANARVGRPFQRRG